MMNEIVFVLFLKNKIILVLMQIDTVFCIDCGITNHLVNDKSVFF